MLLFFLWGKSSKSGVIRSLSNKFRKKSGTAQNQESLDRLLFLFVIEKNESFLNRNGIFFKKITFKILNESNKLQ